MRGARLKAVRQYVIVGFFEADPADHVTASLVGFHLLQQRPFAVKHPDTGGTIDLVAGERVEIGIERLHIDLQVGDRLGSVNQNHDTRVMGQGDHLSYRIEGTQGVGNLGNGKQTTVWRQQRCECLPLDLAGIVNGHHP